MVAAAGAGPKSIPQKHLTSHHLSDAIFFCLTQEASTAAAGIARQMRAESGVKAAVKSFHNNLPSENMQCDLIPQQPAIFTYKNGKTEYKLSKLAFGILAAESRLNVESLDL